MAEMTLTVPSRYVDTWREAALDCVRFWLEGIQKGREEIREALEREDQKHASRRLGDMGDEQRALTEVVGLVSQLPAPGWDGDAEFLASPRVLAEAMAEAVRFCARDLQRDAEFDPVEVETLRERSAELTFWLDEYERAEGARSTEARARLAAQEREAEAA